MTPPSFSPFRDTLVLSPHRPPVEEVTIGGIILPLAQVEAERQKPLSSLALYDIVAAGPDVRLDSIGGTLLGTDAVGLRVWVRSYVVDSYDQAGTFVACEAKDVWSLVEGG